MCKKKVIATAFCAALVAAPSMVFADDAAPAGSGSAATIVVDAAPAPMDAAQILPEPPPPSAPTIPGVDVTNMESVGRAIFVAAGAGQWSLVVGLLVIMIVLLLRKIGWKPINTKLGGWISNFAVSTAAIFVAAKMSGASINGWALLSKAGAAGLSVAGLWELISDLRTWWANRKKVT